jgi:hypothetical protein
MFIHGLHMIAHLMAEPSADECIAERLSLPLSSGTATSCTRRLTKQSGRPGAVPNKPPTVAQRRPTAIVRTRVYEAEGALVRTRVYEAEGALVRTRACEGALVRTRACEAEGALVRGAALGACPPRLAPPQSTLALCPRLVPSVASSRIRAVGSTAHTIIPSISLCQVEGTRLLIGLASRWASPSPSRHASPCRAPRPIRAVL